MRALLKTTVASFGLGLASVLFVAYAVLFGSSMARSLPWPEVAPFAVGVASSGAMFALFLGWLWPAEVES